MVESFIESGRVRAGPCAEPNTEPEPEDPARTLKAALKYLRLNGYTVVNGKTLGSGELTIVALMGQILEAYPDLVGSLPEWLKGAIFQTYTETETSFEPDAKGKQRRMAYFNDIREALELAAASGTDLLWEAARTRRQRDLFGGRAWNPDWLPLVSDAIPVLHVML